MSWTGGENRPGSQRLVTGWAAVGHRSARPQTGGLARVVRGAGAGAACVQMGHGRGEGGKATIPGRLLLLSLGQRPRFTRHANNSPASPQACLSWHVSLPG